MPVWTDRGTSPLPTTSSPPPQCCCARHLGAQMEPAAGCPPDTPPFPKPAWALAAYARAQEDLVGEVAGWGGGTCLWAQDACVGAVPRVQELVPALAGPLSGPGRSPD